MQFIRKNVKPILLIIVAAFVVSIFYGLGQYRSSGGSQQNPGALIAQVNDTGISYQQWQSAFTNFISRYDNQTLSNMNEETLAYIKNSITEQLINSILLYQHAQNENIMISDSDISNELEVVKSTFDSEESFNQALKRNNITVNQLKDDINMQLMIGKAVEQEYDKIEITEEEILQYYEENKEFFFQPEQRKVSHILVESLEEAENIQNQLNDKMVDFEKLATDNSICPSAEQGGDLGYISRGQTVQPFEDAAFSLEPGEISDIVETEFGFHIIKSEEILEEHQSDFEESREEIENILKTQKQNSAINELVTQLREDSEIVIYYDFTSELEESAQAESQEVLSEDDGDNEQITIDENNPEDEGLEESITETDEE